MQRIRRHELVVHLLGDHRDLPCGLTGTRGVVHTEMATLGGDGLGGAGLRSGGLLEEINGKDFNVTMTQDSKRNRL